ncbi:MAG: hypothetical protein FWG63_02515 [Defluviitaleaceae bacterium]|nr:hypothetical protein [Defluviitaleaceae bacterium]
MKWELIKKLEDEKENHANLRSELEQMRKNSLEIFKTKARNAFIGYFAEKGFTLAQDTSTQETKQKNEPKKDRIKMQYKNLSVTLGSCDSNVWTVSCDGSSFGLGYPTRWVNVCQDYPVYCVPRPYINAPIEDGIAYEVEASEHLKNAIANYNPDSCYFAIDNHHQRHATFESVMEKIFSD